MFRAGSLLDIAIAIAMLLRGTPAGCVFSPGDAAPSFSSTSNQQMALYYNLYTGLVAIGIRAPLLL